MIIPRGTIVMVVDGAKQQVYRNEGTADDVALVLADHAEHSSAPTSALGTDRPGRSFQSSGNARAAHEETDFHQREEDAFAANAAARLNELANDGSKLILVAAPHTLGIIRKLLSEKTRSALIAEIAKDLTGHSAQDVKAVLERAD